MTRTSTSESHSGARSTSLFIAGHLGAVSVIYAAAWSFGGGFAPPPFPPDLPVMVHRSSMPSTSDGAEVHLPPASSRDPAPLTSDTPPPWTFDTEGRVQFAPR